MRQEVQNVSSKPDKNRPGNIKKEERNSKRTKQQLEEHRQVKLIVQPETKPGNRQ